MNRPLLRTHIPGPRSRALSLRLRAVECRGVTTLAGEGPIFWEEAHGAFVTDVDGNVFLDLTSAFGVAAVGHGHPRVMEAASRQAARLAHGMGDVYPAAVKVELLERLAALTGGVLSGGILSLSGSDAVESALKTARLKTGRKGVLAFQGGYHGLGYGALEATARPFFREPFADQLGGFATHLPFPRTPDEARGVLEQARGCLDSFDRRPGAVLVEPIQGRGGIRLPPPGFLPELSNLAAEAGALVILDEILTGIGRTGAWFACQHEGFWPDLLAIGKALGGGFPISCCLGKEAVLDAFPEARGEAIHTSTFLGHPVGAAAALAVCDVIEEEGLLERASRLGDGALTRLREGLAGVAEVRGRGLLIGIVLEDRGGTLAIECTRRLLQRGLIVLPSGDAGNVLGLMPPLSIPEDAWAFALDLVIETIPEVLGGRS